MTSVKRASPQQLLAWNRGHWVVESHHHVRDATFREDDSMLRTRPQTTRSPSQSSSATNASCPNPSTASSTPATTMPTSASRSCTQSQDQADRASLPDRNCKLSSPATKASRSPRIRRPIALRAATARQQISKSQPRTRRPAPRSGLRSHHINKHGITLLIAVRAGCCANFSPLPLSIPPGNSFSSFNIELMQRLCRLQAAISPSRGMDPAARCGFGTWRRWSGRFHFKVEHYLRRRSQNFPSVEPILYLLNIFVAYRAKVRALREVLPHQAVGVLIQAALPRMERLGEEEICVKCFSDTPVVCELFAVVIVWTNSAPEPSRRIMTEPTVSFCPPGKAYFVARSTSDTTAPL